MIDPDEGVLKDTGVSLAPDFINGFYSCPEIGMWICIYMLLMHMRFITCAYAKNFYVLTLLPLDERKDRTLQRKCIGFSSSEIHGPTNYKIFLVAFK